MVYSLYFCPRMSMFVLEFPDLHKETMTDQQMLDRCNGNTTLVAWVDFTKQHAGRWVNYDMLPR